MLSMKLKLLDLVKQGNGFITTHLKDIYLYFSYIQIQKVLHSVENRVDYRYS